MYHTMSQSFNKNRLANFKDVVPGCNKLLPNGIVGPKELGEQEDNHRHTKHLPHRADKLLSLLWKHFVQTAHPGLK